MKTDTPQKNHQGDILVVDDNTSNLKFILDALTKAGYRVRPATDGELALQSVRVKLPELILLDYKMPGMNGIEVCKRLKSSPETSDIPVIFLSALGEFDLKVKALEAGGIDYITKPIEPSELLVRVENHLRLFRLQRRLSDQSEKLAKEIAERKLAEKDLKVTNDRLEERVKARTEALYKSNAALLEKTTMLDNILRSAKSTAIATTDLDFNITYYNSVAEKIFGYSSTDVIGQNLQKICTRENVTPDNFNHGVEIVHRDGEYRFTITQDKEEGIRELESTLSGIIAPDGNLVGYSLFSYDVTEHKQAKENIIRLSTAIDQAAEAVIITDLRGNIQYVNPAFEKLTGYTREKAMGKNPSILKSGKQDKAFYEAMWSCLLKGEVWSGHLINRKKDGSLFEEEVSISPVKNNEGVITNFVAVKRDVSKEVLLEKQLQQATKMEAIGTLAGGIAHDFNNILGAILGYTEVARDDLPTDSPIVKDLNKVLESGNRAKDLIQQILAFSRQDETDCLPFLPANIIKKTVTMLRPTLPTTIELRVDIDPGSGPIYANPTQFQQIVMNLCTNAYHAMEKTGGRLDISLREIHLSNEELLHEPDIEAGTFVELTVCDSGSGIAPEIKERIFDPYFTTKETGKGTGMGLSIVHGIVKRFGGFISLLSEADKGTTLHVFFPVIDEDIVPSDQDDAQIEMGDEHILFIDDEEIMVEVGKVMLERLGYRVTVKTSSLEALEIFQDNPNQFDAVVTDQTMPHMTGADLAQKMLTIRPDLPIILCTGYSTTISEQKAKSIGIRAFAKKPLMKKDIAKLIRRALESAMHIQDIQADG